jgi:hypothetical protein
MLKPSFPRRFALILTAAVAALAAGLGVPACTTAVVSGAGSADGRPILWKNRDADDHLNQVVYCADGKYSYIGIVNKADGAGMAIWAGINSQGFAIMNSASYNLEGAENSTAEGNVMKLALQSCATVADFQALLETSNMGGRDVAANFGVIDAKGGAAYFETDKKSYKRFNADDPALAPRGYIIRTNFSESGKPGEGAGFVRFKRASDLVEEAVKSKGLSAELLLRQIARDVANARIGSFPMNPRKKGSPAFAYTADSICRYDTASCAVFTGVNPGEDPALSTLWVIVGQPVTGVAVPLWVAAGSVPKEMAVSRDPSPMTAAFDAVRDYFYPETKGDLNRYLDVDSVSDSKKGLLPPLLAQEDSNFKRVGDVLEKWRRQAPSAVEVAAFENDVASQTLAAVHASLDAHRKDIPPAPPQKTPDQTRDRRGVSVTGLSK